MQGAVKFLPCCMITAKKLKQFYRVSTHHLTCNNLLRALNDEAKCLWEIILCLFVHSFFPSHFYWHALLFLLFYFLPSALVLFAVRLSQYFSLHLQSMYSFKADSFWLKFWAYPHFSSFYLFQLSEGDQRVTFPERLFSVVSPKKERGWGKAELYSCGLGGVHTP